MWLIWQKRDKFTKFLGKKLHNNLSKSKNYCNGANLLKFKRFKRRLIIRFSNPKEMTFCIRNFSNMYFITKLIFKNLIQAKVTKTMVKTKVLMKRQLWFCLITYHLNTISFSSKTQKKLFNLLLEIERPILLMKLSNALCVILNKIKEIWM